MPRPRARPAATRPHTTDLRPAREWLDAHMAELILYGGMVGTRKEVHDDALERTGSIRGADLFAFWSTVKVATPEQVATWPRLSEVRAYEAQGLTLADLQMTPDGLRPAALEPFQRAAAAERQKAGIRPSGNFPKGGRAAEKVADAVRMDRKTLAKTKAVADAPPVEEP